MAFAITPEQFASLSSLDDIYTILHVSGDKVDATIPLGEVHSALYSSSAMVSRLPLGRAFRRTAPQYYTLCIPGCGYESSSSQCVRNTCVVPWERQQRRATHMHPWMLYIWSLTLSQCFRIFIVFLWELQQSSTPLGARVAATPSSCPWAKCRVGSSSRAGAALHIRVGTVLAYI